MSSKATGNAAKEKQGVQPSAQVNWELLPLIDWEVEGKRLWQIGVDNNLGTIGSFISLGRGALARSTRQNTSFS